MSTKTKLPWVAGLMMLALTSFGAWAGAVGAITSVSPAYGSTAGGITVVTIKTTGLADSASTTVTFGTVAVSGLTMTAGVVTVTAPASTVAGGVTLLVTDNAAGTASRAFGFTYTNTTLLINVTVNIPTIIAIQWDATTGTDDANVDHATAAQRITPYSWVVNFGGRTTPFTELSTTYTSSSATEARVFAIQSLSRNNRTRIDARASNPTDATSVWTLAAAAGTDIVNINAQLSGAANTAADLFPAGINFNLTPGGGTPIPILGTSTLVLKYTTPTTAAAASMNVDMISTITLTGSAF